MNQDWLDSNTFKDIIASYLDVKRVGTDRYVAKCPFHNEKTPSFTLFADNRRYYCFGCGEGGDIIKFVSSLNNWDFYQTVKYLRNNWGLDIPGKDNEKVSDTLEKVQSSYRANITNYNRKFFNDLGFSDEDLDYAEAGYADERVNNSLLRQFGAKVMYAFGLINENGNFVMNNRLTFPLRNRRGSVVAFQGRTLFKENQNKYLTSRNTNFFHKSKYLYGLNKLNNSGNRYMVLVEGIKDSIKLSRLGINAVSVLGSKVNEQQVEFINSYLNNHDNELYVMFDGDLAGEKGVEQLLSVMKEKGFFYLIKRTKVCGLGSNQDPAELCQNNDLSSVEGVLYQSVYAYDWLKVRKKIKHFHFRKLTLKEEVQRFFLNHQVYLPEHMLNFLRNEGVIVQKWTALPDFKNLSVVNKVVVILAAKNLKDRLYGGRVNSFKVRATNVLSILIQRMRNEITASAGGEFDF